MVYTNKNFCRGNISNVSPDNGDEFVRCNLAQITPHTEIFAGITGLKFTKCNLVNCDIPVDAVKDGCLHFYKTFCSHINPSLLATGEIEECVPECEHMIPDPDELTIDGFSLGKNYQYVDKVVL